MEITIKIDGTRNEVSQALLDRVLGHLYEHGQEMEMLKGAIDKTVERIIAERAEALTDAALLPKIAEALEGDFGKSDEYGRHAPKNLRSLIVGYFTSTNQYGRNESKIGSLVENKVAEIMKAELQPAIDAARKTLRERLDHILGEKVSLAVREAVGLR